MELADRGGHGAPPRAFDFGDILGRDRIGAQPWADELRLRN
jgi:hypothetical protein